MSKESNFFVKWFKKLTPGSWFALLVLTFSILMFVALLGISFLLPVEEKTKVSPEKVTPSTPKTQPAPNPEIDKIRNQLDDVERKIKELPELEEDIFTKCMEGEEGVAENIKNCEEKTQKQIFTLSQELTNLKNSLQERLKELQEE